MTKIERFMEINNKTVIRLPDIPPISQRNGVQQVFIIGSKGIPALYGGFETFVENLTKCRKNDKIQYHISRIANDNMRYEYNGAECFNVKVPPIGAMKAVWYDIASLSASLRWCQRYSSTIKRPVFYILACRIGPFIGYFKKKIKKLGGVLYVNPDGHEWKRDKWNKAIRLYWKLSERLMVKHADLMICDSVHIKNYICSEYAIPSSKTVFIAYGADSQPYIPLDERNKYVAWLKKYELSKRDYYLAVSRFVPENNFEVMIREFMSSDSKRDFVIITTDNVRFYNTLEKKLHFSKDKRIKFVGTVYDTALLKLIRENAYAYLHGHQVGGTNPSLLEALENTELNLLFDVGFNREVAENSAFYWTKELGNLSSLISKLEQIDEEQIHKIGASAKKRIKDAYQWQDIVAKYEAIFLLNVPSS